MLQDSIHKYIRENLLERMQSEGMLFWRQNILSDHHRSILEGKNWEYLVDLSDSILLLQYVSLPQDSLRIREKRLGQVMAAVEALRQESIHRYAEVSVSNLQLAMIFPTMLKDDDRAAKLEDMWNRVSRTRPEGEWEALTKEVREAFEAVAFPAEASEMTGHQLLYSIQRLLEETLFAFGRMAWPELVQRLNYTMLEQIEINRWLYHLEHTTSGVFSSKSLRNMLHRARFMRNCWVHRTLADEYNVLLWVYNAIRLAVSLDDFEGALKVEILAEQWFENSTRLDVLERLRGVYLEDQPTDKLAKEDITKRHMAIKSILTAASFPLEPHTETVTHPETQSQVSASPSKSGLETSEAGPRSSSEIKNPDKRVEDARTEQQDAKLSEWPASMHSVLKTIKE